MIEAENEAVVSVLVGIVLADSQAEANVTDQAQVEADVRLALAPWAGWEG